MEIILRFFFPFYQGFWGFPQSSVCKSSACNAGYPGLIPESGLAWGIPWTEEPNRLPSTGSQESDDLTTKPPLPLPWFLILQSLYLLVPALQFFIAHIYFCVEIWLVLPFWSPFFLSFLPLFFPFEKYP